MAQSNPIQCTGHSDLVQAHDGSWWAVFLATRPNGQVYHLGRETFLSPVSWTRDNWPVINGNGIVHMRMEVKHCHKLKLSRSVRYEFDEEVLPLAWNYYRHPQQGNYSLHNGCLVLKADKKEPAFTGIRQCDFNMCVETCIDFVPTAENVRLA